MSRDLDAVTKVKHSVYDILTEIDPVPDREGIQSTPERVAKMWVNELTMGYGINIPALFKLFPDEGFGGLVTIMDVPVTSTCEHHMVPIVGYAHIGYFPGAKGVIGLSKMARVVNAFSRRLQIQERLTQQIIDAIEEHMEPRGVMVVVEAEHLCMTMRGVQAPGTITKTSTVSGMFRENNEGEKDEFLRLIGNKHG